MKSLSFKEYAQNKDIEVLKSILIEEGYDLPSMEQLIDLLEAGFLQKLGQSRLGKAAKAATLAAAMGGAAGVGSMMNQSRASDSVNKNYPVAMQRLLADKQAQQDFAKDTEWSKSNSKGMSPSERSQFVHGVEVASSVSIKNTLESIKDGVEAETNSRQFVLEIVTTKDLGTGGFQVLVTASGDVLASSQQEANQKVEDAIKKECQKMGVELTGLKNLIPDNFGEAVGIGRRYQVKMKLSLRIPKR